MAFNQFKREETEEDIAKRMQLKRTSARIKRIKESQIIRSKQEQINQERKKAKEDNKFFAELSDVVLEDLERTDEFFDIYHIKRFLEFPPHKQHIAGAYNISRKEIYPKNKDAIFRSLLAAQMGKVCGEKYEDIIYLTSMGLLFDESLNPFNQDKIKNGSVDRYKQRVEKKIKKIIDKFSQNTERYNINKDNVVAEGLLIYYNSIAEPGFVDLRRIREKPKKLSSLFGIIEDYIRYSDKENPNGIVTSSMAENIYLKPIIGDPEKDKKRMEQEKINLMDERKKRSLMILRDKLGKNYPKDLNAKFIRQILEPGFVRYLLS